MSLAELVEETVKEMSKIGIESDRQQMLQYMKNHFDYFGVKAPARKEVQKALKIEWKQMNDESLFAYAEAL